MNIYSITTAIIREGNKYLIAKRAASKKFAPGQWEFISGFVDIPDTPEQTILREIQEELSAEGSIISKADQFSIIDSEGQWEVTPFLIRLSNSEIKINPGDHSAIKWVNVRELSEYSDLKSFLDNKGIQMLLSVDM